VFPPDGTTLNAFQNFHPERSVGSQSADPRADLAAKQAARHLNLSESWLAKRRVNGDGPPYVKLGGAVRYAEASLQQWMKGEQRNSTSG
jgi:predicted DNA-binding transcriptional regulator AlpA